MNSCQSSETKTVNKEKSCFHCPNCGDTKLTPHFDMTDTDAKIMCFWICQGCGNMFRDFDDLVDENKRFFSLRKTMLLLSCGSLAIFGLRIGVIQGKRIVGIGVVISSAVLYTIVNRCLRLQKKKWDVEARNLCWKCYR